MVLRRNNSHLTETDFSSFNLRDAYISDYPEYAAALRDEAIFSNYGITVTVKVPKYENDVDEYSNFVDEDFIITSETVVPLFSEYRQTVSIEGLSADGTDGLYPLQIIIPTKLHLPRNSRIVLNEYNAKEEKIAREWVVLGTEVKQLSNSKTHSKIVNCVAAKQLSYQTGMIKDRDLYSIFYFDINNVAQITKVNYIRSYLQGYFAIHTIDSNKNFRKVLLTALNENAISDYSETDQEFLDVNTSYIPMWQEVINYVDSTIPKPKYIKPEPVCVEFLIKSSIISVLY